MTGKKYPNAETTVHEDKANGLTNQEQTKNNKDENGQYLHPALLTAL